MTWLNFETLTGHRQAAMYQLQGAFYSVEIRMKLGHDPDELPYLGMAPWNAGRVWLEIEMPLGHERLLTFQHLKLIAEFLGTEDLAVRHIECIADPDEPSEDDSTKWVITTSLENWK